LLNRTSIPSSSRASKKRDVRRRPAPAWSCFETSTNRAERSKIAAALVPKLISGASSLVIVTPLSRLEALRITPEDLSRARIKRTLAGYGARTGQHLELGEDPAGDDWLHVFEFVDGATYRYTRQPRVAP
jgi:hypothetical protein